MKKETHAERSIVMRVSKVIPTLLDDCIPKVAVESQGKVLSKFDALVYIFAS